MLIASLSLFSSIFAVTVAPPSIHSSLLQYMVLLLLLLCEVIKLAGSVEISFGNFIMVQIYIYIFFHIKYILDLRNTVITVIYQTIFKESRLYIVIFLLIFFLVLCAGQYRYL